MAQGISANVGGASRGGAAVVGLSIVAGLGYNFVFRLVRLVRGRGRDIGGSDAIFTEERGGES
jgi:hypothetical protein